MTTSIWGETESAGFHRRRFADRRGEDRRHERRHPLHGVRPRWSCNAEAIEITEGCTRSTTCSSSGRWCKRSVLEERLEDRFILFGEWLYARHSVHYRQPAALLLRVRHLRQAEARPSSIWPRGWRCSKGRASYTVPCRSSRRRWTETNFAALIGPSRFDSQFENPLTGRTDNLMEGLYLRTEADGAVTGRAKFVRAEFVEKVKQSEHWQHQAMVPNLLADGAEIWS